MRNLSIGGGMNRQNPYTQAAITRAIKAAMAAGLKVTAVRPDGTVLTRIAGKPAVCRRRRIDKSAETSGRS